MKIRFLILALSVFIAGTISAQTTKKAPAKSDNKLEAESSNASPDNYVVNPSFEDCEIKTLKNYGMLNDLCTPWFTPNKTSADLFAQGVKSPKTLAGQNDYGKEDPADGTCYAGIRAFSKDPKKNRTYLETKLRMRLEKNKLYCVRFQASLADLSKFAVNNIGVYFSDRKIANANDYAITLVPQVTIKNNTPIKTMEGWETICGTFLAKGNEEYIIIGGFGEENALQIEKMKKPAGVTGTVLNEAYYFLDNIEIVAVDAPSQCMCGKMDALEPDFIYTKAVARNINSTPQQQIAAFGVYFANLSSDVPELFYPDLEEVATLMLNNPGINIELVGHSEADEINEAKVNVRLSNMAMKRAQKVKAYLLDKGIEDSRISISSQDDQAPANTKGTPLGKAQNRRVEIKVK